MREDGGGGCPPHLLGLPRTDILLGRMVTAPSATSSRRSTGALLEPQLSEPIQKKWPVWLALRAASSTLLWGHSSPTQVCTAARLPHPPRLSPRLYLDPPSTLYSPEPMPAPTPSQEDTPHTTAYAHPQAIPSPLPPGSQSLLLSVLWAWSSPALWPMPIHVTTVTFLIQVYLREPTSGPAKTSRVSPNLCLLHLGSIRPSSARGQSLPGLLQSSQP